MLKQKETDALDAEKLTATKDEIIQNINKVFYEKIRDMKQTNEALREQLKKKKRKKKFPLAPMGVLAPVSAHAGPSAQPPMGTSGKFPAHVSA